MTGQTVQLRIVQVHVDGALEVYGKERDQHATIPPDARVTIDGQPFARDERMRVLDWFDGCPTPWVCVAYSPDGSNVIGVAFRSTPFYD